MFSHRERAVTNDDADFIYIEWLLASLGHTTVWQIQIFSLIFVTYRLALES